MAVSVRVTDNSEQILKDEKRAKERIFELWGLAGEKFAKEKISEPKPHAGGAIRPNVITGLLRNGITHDADNDAVYIGTNIEYAPHIEFGTRNSRAYPFLKPAVTEHMNTYRAIARGELEQG
ncbi:MAG: hypothetical protein WC374_05835 [Phycisphaerae bacterium]|jgi:phage gpG-like protein